MLVFWALGGIAYALFYDEDLAPDVAPVEPEAERGPELVTRGHLQAPGSEAKRPVPDEMLRAFHRLHEEAERTRLLGWLDDDPTRVLALLRALVPNDASVPQFPRAYTPADFAAGAARQVFGSWSRYLQQYLPYVVEELRAPPADDTYLAALLGALLTSPTRARPIQDGIAVIAADDTRTAVVRRLAGEILLALGGPVREAAIKTILRAPARQSFGSVRRVLEMLRRDPDRARAHLDDLLACYADDPQFWNSRAVLQLMVEVAGDDPRVREHLLAALRAKSPSIRRYAQGLLFKGSVEDVLAFLETAPAAARIAGAARLLERGVDGDLLREHVLVALRSGGPMTRTKAITMLGKVGGDVRDVLPIVEEHMDTEDKTRWLSGVQALGALSTVPGDKEPAIRRLLEVGRRPDVRVRKAAVQAILMHDAKPAPVIEFLTYLLDDADAGVRAEAVDALGELSAGHATARQALERARTDASGVVRKLVEYWLEEDEDD